MAHVARNQLAIYESMTTSIALPPTNDFAVVRASVSGVGESRAMTNGMSELSAPVLETEPTSSWLKSAIRLTFDSFCESATLHDSSLVLSMRASRAQYLHVAKQLQEILRAILTNSFGYLNEEKK